MLFLNIITVLLVSTMIAMGLFVLKRNPTQSSNRIYLLISIMASVWAVVFRFIDLSSSLEIAQLLTNMSYIVGIVLTYIVYVFTAYFPIKVASTKRIKYFGIVVATTVLLASSGLMETVTVQDSLTNYGEILSLWFIPYVLVLLALVYASSRNLLNAYKQSTTNRHKSQIKYVTVGLILSVVVVVTFADIIPLLLPETLLDDFAAFGMVFFLYFGALAIIQKRLFDLRQLAARITGFTLTVLFVTAVYFIAEYATDIILVDFSEQIIQLVFNVIFTGVLIFTYDNILSFFSKFSLRLFSEDVYDAQQLLDDLNQTIVGKPELENLLVDVSSHIQNTLHASFCGFYVRETSYFNSRFISNTPQKLNPEDLEKLRQLTPKVRYKVHSVEVEPGNEEEKTLNEILVSNKVELLGRLVDTLDYEVAGVGYLLLGSKRSGVPYSEQDMKILEIIVNELVIAIENSLRLEEIEQFNLTLQKKIDDATKKLKNSNDKLLALDQAKDEFVSMASHQLRTPLTSIKGYLSMVLEGDAGKVSDTQKQMLGQAFFSSQRMVYLISDLLNVSRLKTGKFIIDAKPTNLADLIESEVNQLIEGANAKDLTMAYSKPKKFPLLMLDDMKIRQVIMNFTDNAIYYTPTGGKITIRLKETPSSVEFTVHDNGIGVPKEQQHKLFTKFYRADNARKTRPDGTGLGIFMAKKVIVAQGGSIIFDSKEGKGSTFGFSFPKEKLLVEKPDIK